MNASSFSANSLQRSVGSKFMWRSPRRLNARARDVAEVERAGAAWLHEPALAGHVAAEQLHDDVGDVSRLHQRDPDPGDALLERRGQRRLGEARADGVDADPLALERRAPARARARRRRACSRCRSARSACRSARPARRSRRSPRRRARAARAAPPARRTTTPSRLTPIARRYSSRSKSSPNPEPVRDARVEEDVVDTTGLLHRERDHRLVRVEVADVDADEVPADLLGDLAAAVLVDVRDDDHGARLGQRERGRPADSARAAGDAARPCLVGPCPET